MGTESIMRIENPQIDFTTMENIKKFSLVYHEGEDTLFLRPRKPRPATSFDWDGEIWVRVDPENGEVVGLEIDDFQGVFLRKYPELAKAWEEVKPLYHRKKMKKGEEVSWESFLQIILNFLLGFFRDNPQQASFGMAPV